MRFALFALLFIGCGHDHTHSNYGSFQACFDQHKNVESLTVTQSIVVCCLDHPINGVSEVCGATASDCGTYLNANLAATSASGTDIMAACTEYVTQKAM